jgi:hypothetical protein
MSTKIMKMQMDKFPYLSNLKESIGNLKTVIELYQKRKKLIGENKDSLSEYEKNEIEIKIWLTNKDLASAFKDLNDRETKFKELYKFYSDNLNEVSISFDDVLTQAKKLKDEKIKEEIEKYKGFDFKENYEAKIHLYSTLKKFISENK